MLVAELGGVHADWIVPGVQIGLYLADADIVQLSRVAFSLFRNTEKTVCVCRLVWSVEILVSLLFFFLHQCLIFVCMCSIEKERESWANSPFSLARKAKGSSFSHSLDYPITVHS